MNERPSPWCYVTYRVTDADLRNPAAMEDAHAKALRALIEGYPDADMTTVSMETQRREDTFETEIYVTALRRPQEDASGSPDSA